MAGGLNRYIAAASLIGGVLAGHALVRLTKRFLDKPRDDLSDGFGLDDFVPRGVTPFPRAIPAAVPHLGGRDSFHFWGLPDDEGFEVHTYFDGSVHGDEK